MAIRLTLTAAALLLLAACSSDTAAPAPETSQPLPVATPAPATATARPATSTATATDTATATPPPADTATSTPSATDTPTPLPTDTPTPAPDPSALNLELVEWVDGLDQPVFATHAGDGSGRLFIVEKGGTILVLGEDGVQPQPFLDITGRVGSSSSEQGLLGLAFHPDFAANGRFFVYYTDRDGDTVISRFQAGDDRTTADPDSEVVLLTQDQPAGNHNGGMIAFGPDGYLYAGLGDGGGAGDRYGNGQNLGTILGTIVRIDVDGDEAVVPADNPFVGQDGARPRSGPTACATRGVSASTARPATCGSPMSARTSGRRSTSSRPAALGGENYGWPITEAMHCYDADSCDRAGLTEPVAEYEHANGCSVTGGYVYRGEEQPAMQGIYFYGDYCSGRVWGTAPRAGKRPAGRRDRTAGQRTRRDQRLRGN